MIKTDNDILNFIKKSGQENKNTQKEADIPTIRSDVFLNWTKQSSETKTSKLQKLSNRAKELKEVGLGTSDIKDVMISEGNQIDDVNVILASAPEKSKVAKVYNDVKETVESLATSLGKKDFVNLITAGGKLNKAIVVFASKNEEVKFNDLMKYVEARGAQTNLMDEMHSVLQPHIDREISKSYLLAEVKRGETRIGANAKRTVFSIAQEGGKYEVNTEDMTCNCSRYVEGNFQNFGIPCEHIVLANSRVSKEDLTFDIERRLKKELGV